MIKRTASAKDEEPGQMTFELPSEKEHLFQVTDYYDQSFESNKFNLDPDTILVKCEVVGGDESGVTLLNRVSLDDGYKGFFATRLFLKAIGEEYKGEQFAIDTDDWIGKQFYATVKHVESKGKTYANIGEFNFDKKIEQSKRQKAEPAKDGDVAWDE